MVEHGRKKVRRLRGSVSCGHGRVGRHRKHEAGRGNSGGMTHHRILFDRFHPGYFGKVGMRHYHLKRNPYFKPSINIDKLWSLLPEGVRKGSKDYKDKVVVIDCEKAGYFKVLGKGRLPNQPVIVKARFFSKKAERRIKAIGGACVVSC
jgi:large subunit ribosomal protein L27Ae